MTVLPSAPWQGTAGLNLLQVLKLKTAEFKILTRSHTPGVSAFLLRRADSDRPVAAGARCPGTATAISRWRRS